MRAGLQAGHRGRAAGRFARCFRLVPVVSQRGAGSVLTPGRSWCAYLGAVAASAVVGAATCARRHWDRLGGGTGCRVARSAVWRHPKRTDTPDNERPVKPSAQPTLVRTQHLPLPAETARGLGILGLTGRLAGVARWVMMWRRDASRCGGHGHMADRNQPEQGVLAGQPGNRGAAGLRRSQADGVLRPVSGGR
jgi:hypothetical protein